MEPKEISSRLIPRLLVVFTRQLEILVTTLRGDVHLRLYNGDPGPTRVNSLFSIQVIKKMQLNLPDICKELTS